MAKGYFKNYLRCTLLLTIAVISFLAFFIIDVIVFQVKETIFTAFYGYGLFPIFAIVYGIFSYRFTKKIMLPNVLYILFCMTFIALFITIPVALKQATFELVVVGILAAVSIIASSVISTITAIIVKSVNIQEK